ncbi:MAG: hypothetical protein KKD36_09935 [Bacteroidetes bacterium]|jgi:DNA-binding HxlR family transcriptional regulator|nr:hypothetical protein [Bacteroidota bacterium]
MTENQIKAREIIIMFQFQNPPLHFEMAKTVSLMYVNEIKHELKEWGEVWMKNRLKHWEEIEEEISKL